MVPKPFRYPEKGSGHEPQQAVKAEPPRIFHEAGSTGGEDIIAVKKVLQREPAARTGT